MTLYCVLLIFPILIKFILNGNQRIKDPSKVLLIVVFFVLFIISGLRASSVGIDTRQYIVEYCQIRDYGIGAYSKNGGSIEYGYVFLNWLLSRIFYNPQIVFLVYSFVIYFGVGLTIYRYSSNTLMSTFLYIMWSFPSSMNTMRQHFACSIILLSLPYLEKKKLLNFLLAVIIAFLFHKSAIIFAIFIFIPIFSKKNNEFKSFFILLILLLISYFIIDYIISIIIKLIPRYYHYIYGYIYGGGSGEMSFFWQTIYFCLVIATFFILKENSINQNNGHRLLNEHSVIIIMFGLLVALQFEISFFNANVSSIFSRIEVYTKNGLFIIIPYVIENILSKYSSSKKERTIVLLGFYFSFICFGINMIRQDGYGIIPYNIFEMK